MATRLYWHDATSWVPNLPTTNQSALTSNKNVDAFTVNRSMNTITGTAQVSKSLAPVSTVSTQNYYFTRFVSTPLAAQTIDANTWNVYFGASESNTKGNFPVNGNSQPIRITFYVWRPSTQSKVGTILEGNSNNTFDEPWTTSNTEYAKDGTFAGTSVTAQDGDVLVYELWFVNTLDQTGSYTHTIYYDGTATNVTEASHTTIASIASYIETPQTLTFLPSTRFYLHAASSSSSAVAGTLPSAKQSTLTATASFDALSVNRSMDTTKGAGPQTDLTKTTGNTGSTYRMYMTRFLSKPIDETSIAAVTWTLSISAWASSSLPYYPTPASGTSAFLPGCLYIWRPSTGAVVGNIFDGNSATVTAAYGQTSQKTQTVTFTGSAITIQSGDILVLEAWTGVSTNSSYTWHWAYDGATVTAADNTAATNHAAYIETPEYLLFVPPPPDTITMTPNAATITNKFIQKI